MKSLSFLLLLSLAAPSFANDIDGSVEAAEKRLSYLEGSLKVAHSLQADAQSLSNLGAETEKLTSQIASLKTRILGYKANRSAILKRRYVAHLSVIKNTSKKLDLLNFALKNLTRHGGGSITQYQGTTFEEDLVAIAGLVKDIKALQAGRSNSLAFPADMETSNSYIADVTAASDSEKAQVARARETLAVLRFDRTQYLIGKDDFNMSADQVVGDHVLSVYADVEAALAVSDFLSTK